MQTAAYAQEPRDPVALNSLANYYLHKWFSLPARAGGLVEGSDRLTVVADAKGRRVAFERGDLIRVGESFTARVLEPPGDDGVMLLNRPYHPRGADEASSSGGGGVEETKQSEAGTRPLYRKQYKQALHLAGQAAEAATELPEPRAEALYIKARVLHMLDDLEQARRHYAEACREAPGFAPAQYGSAQMLAAHSRALRLRDRAGDAAAAVAAAVAALGKVLDKAPNDPDALTLLGLLLAEQGGQEGGKEEGDAAAAAAGGGGGSSKAAALERLRKAVELRPEVVEAWVALAQVHQRAPAPDPREALRCLQEAERLLRLKRETVPAALLSNLGALFHSRGQEGDQATAKRYYLAALEAFSHAGGSGLGDLETQYLHKEQPITHPANEVFWRWDVLHGVRARGPVAFGSREVSLSSAPAGGGDGGADAAALKPGDQVKLVLGPGPRDAFVSEVEEVKDNGGGITLKHSFLLLPPTTTTTAAAAAGGDVPLARKASRGLLRHETLTTVFNLAMIHQDMGEAAAARELYLAIAHQYPAYTAAYVKLALLAQAQGRPAECAAYLAKARAVSREDKDVQAICGKVDQDAGRRDQAQRGFEPLNKEGDAYAMVALGNLYFTNAMTVPDKAHHIGHARVYNTKVLKRQPGNLYAAHGLGLILAEEFGKVDDARAVLQAIREKSGDKPDEILVNIAHLFVAQGQRNAAIHCYETYLRKQLPGACGTDGLLYGKVLEYVAHAHFLDKGFERALRVLLKAHHWGPARRPPHALCNVALALEEAAMEVFKRANRQETRTVHETRRAEQDLVTAIALYSRPEVVDTLKEKAHKRAKHLRDNMDVARRYVEREEQRLQKEEALKQEQARRVAEELERREAAKRAQQEEEERKREAARQAALEREEQQRKLLSQWAQEPKEEPAKKKGRREKAAAGSGSDNDSDVDEPKPPRPRAGSSSSSSSSSSGSSSSSSDSSDDDEEHAAARHRRRQQEEAAAAAAAAGGGEGGVDGSDDEAYGFRGASFKKDRQRAAAAASAAAAGEGMEVDDDGDEGRKRKAAAAAAEGEGGAKKRRVQRAGGSSSGESSSDEDELDLGGGGGGVPTTTATASAPSSSSPSPAPAAAASGASPAAAEGRRRVAVEEEESSDEE